MSSQESLGDFVDRVCGNSYRRVEADLGSGFVRLCVEEAERRQAAHDIRSSEDIVIELLRNSRDAHAQHIFLATCMNSNHRNFIVIDDGEGIPPELHESIFDSRVTSKLDSISIDSWGIHGRGMALYSIALQAEHAYVKSSNLGFGTSIVVETDLSKVGERSDQSTFPSFSFTDKTTLSVRGPKNIVRIVAEFSFEYRDTLTVYMGSPAEIASALYHYGHSETSAVHRAFSSDIDSSPLCKRLAMAGDAKEFAVIASNLGLNISERSAYRIMDMSYSELPSLLERIAYEGFGSRGITSDKNSLNKSSVSPTEKVNKGSTVRSIPMDPADLESFALQVKAAYKDLAERYYLEPNVDCSVTSRSGLLRLSIPTVPKSV